MRVTERVEHDATFIVLDFTDKGPVVSAVFENLGAANSFAEQAAENHEREFMVTKSISSVTHQRVHTVTRKFYNQADE